ncbi:hypothetical protein Mterra_00103 [Calidithermus terrae]|uniref:Uncharacterized protein n=1 Tax=Calidithermus terrae TaxID=1408545 RepID=A0A399F6I3_9DEIN|nr:hypothetical protein [Calidithermus terrae]RIH90879.1 hypothetical protein Mterra_00103 [Calidithermus terrae]
MSDLERRLERIEAELSADEPVLVAVVYGDELPGTDPTPLTPEQLERARELFRRAREADPGLPYYVVAINTPDPE